MSSLLGSILSATYDPLSGSPSTIEYLVVAGGGGGGTNRGGGAGAGGVLQGAGFSVASGVALTVTVGAGGVASGSSPYGQNGNNSVFSSIIATGGGAGANNVSSGAEYGSNGGSGGGTRNTSIGAVGLGVSGQGNNGAAGNGGYAGGGGGAGANPLPNTSNTPDGGTGICSSITGQGVFYGGGGGGAWSGATGGIGGAGGGGTGSSANGSVGSPGSANTGGGGGGGADGNTSGGAGGSGIVIIRYPATASPPTATTGSPRVSSVGGYQIYVWTSSGSITF